jgi:adiponectin receptor
MDALDLSSSIQSFVSLRSRLLSSIAELEDKLSSLEPPDVEAWIAKGETTLEDGKQWLTTALELLHEIRVGVSSHLPDLPDVPSLEDVKLRLPDMPSLKSLSSLQSGVRSTLDDVRTRLHDIDLPQPLSYIPVLSNHLHSLQQHLSSIDFPSSYDIAPQSTISELTDSLLASLLASELVVDILAAASDIADEGEDVIERAAKEVSSAVKRSVEGVRLIKYSELPEKWRNNPFVIHGYRSASLVLP